MILIPRYGMVVAAFLAFAALGAAVEPEGKSVLVAAAIDVQAIIVRDDAGRMHRYSKGDVVVDSDWRVASVRNDGVEFESLLPRMGARVRMRVPVGDSIRLRVPSISGQFAIPHGQAQAMPAGLGKR